MKDASGDNLYRSVFGFHFPTDATILSNCDYNLSLALRRLFAVRVPEIPGKHVQLYDNQARYISDHEAHFDALRKKYRVHLDSYRGSEEEALQGHDAKHPKRALRIRAWEQLNHKGWRFLKRHPWARTPWLKFKRNEYAKPNKYGRTIVDLGVEASLRGFALAERIKCAMAAEPIEYLGGSIHFCKKPDPIELQKHFNNLINPPGRYYFVYFSDDSCFSLRVGGEVKLFNIDISSCDASHTRALFTSITNVLTGEAAEDFKVLVQQCQLPLKIISSRNSKWKIKIRPTGPKLYSGSVITTLVNNFANILIAFSLAEMVYLGPRSIELAAEKCGYVVTGTEPLVDFTHLQFLKHSPCVDVFGAVVPILNPAVILRASGVCEGDLPGRGPTEARARSFQRGLIHGAYPRLCTPFIDALNTAVGVGPARTSQSFVHKVLAGEYPTYTVSTQELFRRYALTSPESLLIDVARNTYRCSYTPDRKSVV